MSRRVLVSHIHSNLSQQYKVAMIRRKFCGMLGKVCSTKKAAFELQAAWCAWASYHIRVRSRSLIWQFTTD